MKYKIFASDLDGTMFGTDCIAPKENVEAIVQMQQEGVHFVIATGRSADSVEGVLKRLPVEVAYVISCNGGVISKADTGEIIYSRFLAKEEASYIMKESKQFDCTMIAYIDEQPFSDEEDEETRMYEQKAGVAVIIDENVHQSYSGTCNKIIFKGAPACLEKLRVHFAQWIEGKVACFYSAPDLLEFVNINASKGNALTYFANMLGVKMEEVIAIGDYRNDFEMIQVAGLGVAPANAMDEIKEIADVVLKKTAEEGAVAEAIRTLVLCNA